MFDKLRKDKRAIGVRGVVGAAVAILLIGILVPIGLLAVADANTTGWNASVITIFQTVLPILAVIGLALKFLPGSRK